MIKVKIYFIGSLLLFFSAYTYAGDNVQKATFSELVELVLLAVKTTSGAFRQSRVLYTELNEKIAVLMPGFDDRMVLHENVFACIKVEYSSLEFLEADYEQQLKDIITQGNDDVINLRSKLKGLERSIAAEIKELEKKKEELEEQFKDIKIIYEDVVGDYEDDAERLLAAMKEVSDTYDALIAERDLFIRNLQIYIEAIETEDNCIQIKTEDLENIMRIG